MRAIALALLSVVLSGCDAYHYHAGRFHEARSRLPDALKHYEAFLDAHPADQRAAELRVRAGGVYARLQRCLEARRHYEAAAREFPRATPWAALAKSGIMSCPDYFPLAPGRAWVYGDSASGGKAMRLEWEVRASTDTGRGLIQTQLFAGPRKLQSSQILYQFSDWTLWQTDSEGRGPLLQYPFTPGRSWSVKKGARALTYRIESDAAAVDVAAGSFTGCLKIRESTKGFDSWRYDYYCPFVGRALTTVAGPGYENPNTELLSYR